MASRSASALALVLALAGCVTTPEPVELRFERSEYGVLIPCAGDVCRELTDDEQRTMIVDLLNAYECSVEASGVE